MMDANTTVAVQYIELDLRINQDDGIGGPRIECGSACGQGRAWIKLIDLPAWLAARPGTLIVAIRAG